MDRQTKEFIQLHISDDVHSLALQSKRYPEIDMPLVIRQISGRQKIKTKVPSLFENDEVLYPQLLSVEQSSSEITAQYKAGLISGKSLVDLTGGFGIDFIFISKNFEEKVYVETNLALCTLAEHNFRVLGLTDYKIYNQNAEDFISQIPYLECIYIDPHRRSDTGRKTILIEDCEPDVSILRVYLKKSKLVMIKLSPMLDISRALKSIPETTEIHIVAVENECKEVLLIMDNSVSIRSNDLTSNIGIKTINFHKGIKQCFDFILEDEINLAAKFTSESLKYIYEANAAIMKSGAFKSIAEKFSLKTFHPNTRLYTADNLIINFPGRIFEVLKSYGSNKKELQELKKNYPNASVNLRNHPLTVETFRKKYGIKEGNTIFIFGCRVLDETIRYLVCKKKIL